VPGSDARELDAGVDAELLEDVAHVGVRVVHSSGTVDRARRLVVIEGIGARRGAPTPS
jgi:hypothetical protein